MLSNFYKQNKNDKIWWIDDLDFIGKHMFSFDKVKIFNLFADYPHNLTAEQKEILIKKILIGKNFLRKELNNKTMNKSLSFLRDFILLNSMLSPTLRKVFV